MILANYLRRQVLKPFLVVSLVLTGIFAALMAARYLAQAAEGRIPTEVIGRLILLRVLIAQEILLPTTFYFSVFWALGRLYRRAEMIAMYAAGFSFRRVNWAVLSLALALSLLTALFSFEIRPWAWKEFYRLKASSQRTFDLSRLRAGVFYELPEKRVFFAEKISRQDLRAEGVFLYQSDKGGPSVIRAKEASQELSAGEIFLVLRHGYQYDFDQTKALVLVSEFEVLKIFMARIGSPKTTKVKALPTRALWPPTTLEQMAEWQWRLSSPLSTLLLAFVALNLSSVRPRQTHLRRFPLVVLLFALFFYGGAIFKKMLMKGLLPVWPGVFTAHLALLVVALICYRFWTRP